MSSNKNEIQKTLSPSQDIEAFIKEATNYPSTTKNVKGRLLFALDATASRQKTWDHACQLQADMFKETSSIGGLQLQLCYFRGYNEFKKSDWLDSADQLTKIMTRVHCAAGHTQIFRALQHCINETQKNKIQALVFIGDSMEENLNNLCTQAGKLGLLATPIFLFQEGNDLTTTKAMQEIARLSGGAYGRFDESCSDQLRELLTAVAIFACGGKKALEHYAYRQSEKVLQLCKQLK